MSYINVSYCGNDHQEWLNNIDFYKTEFNILEKKLSEVAGKNSDREVLALVEHFQNQFVVQRNNIDEINHNIHDHAGKVSADAQKHAGKMESVLVSEHDLVKEQVVNFERIVNDLRHEFNLFLAEKL